MISIIFSPQEMLKHISKQARTKRLALNFSQETLAERSGVSWGTLKKFEQSAVSRWENYAKDYHVGVASRKMITDTLNRTEKMLYS